MKDNNVVDMSRKRPRPGPPPVTDFWFAQVDTRLNRIEAMVRRLEWHIWAILCGLGGLLTLTVFELLSA